MPDLDMYKQAAALLPFLNPDKKLDLNELYAGLFLGYHPPSFARQLAKLDDGLPLPQIFSWRPAEETQAEALASLSREERKIHDILNQLLYQNRKSGKYFEAFRDVVRAHPDSQYLAMQLLAYLLLWEPEEADRLKAELVKQQPDWRLMRYSRATQMLLETDPNDPDPTVLAGFLELLDQRLELHEHFRETDSGPDETEVMMFYSATAAYFILTENYYRAIYSLNLANLAGAEHLETMMNQLFLKLMNSDKMHQFKAFLLPLSAERELRSQNQA